MVRKTLAQAFGTAREYGRLWPLVLLVTTNLRRLLMTLGLLDGFKTYIVALAMVLAALAQLVGLDLPSFDGHASGQLLMEGLAILFLRKGIKAA